MFALGFEENSIDLRLMQQLAAVLHLVQRERLTELIDVPELGHLREPRLNRLTVKHRRELLDLVGAVGGHALLPDQGNNLGEL